VKKKGKKAGGEHVETALQKKSQLLRKSIGPGGQLKRRINMSSAHKRACPSESGSLQVPVKRAQVYRLSGKRREQD